MNKLAGVLAIENVYEKLQALKIMKNHCGKLDKFYNQCLRESNDSKRSIGIKFRISFNKKKVLINKNM